MYDAKRVFQTGTFDVKNYGDLLFPLIANFRLNPWNIKLLPISPTGFATGWRDAVATAPIGAMLTEPNDIDAVLIGGGNIVHAEHWKVREYESAGVGKRAYAGLWLGATLVAAMRDIPVAWNAPGVPVPLNAELEAANALRATDYVSLRDCSSGNFLGRHKGVEFSVVPDTAIDVSHMWPRHALAPAFKALLERKAAPADTRFVTIHVKERSLDRDHAELAAAIEHFAHGHGLMPLLIAIGPCHDDHITARRIASHLKFAHVLLDEPLGLSEIAAAIAHSALFLGASLHGYITSAAYNVPGVIVAKPALPKFSGFLAHIERPQDLAHDWSAAFDLGAGQLAEGPAQRIPASISALVDAHWGRVRAAIFKPKRRSAERTRFLRRYLERGARTGGDGWLFEPLVVSPHDAQSRATR